MVSSVIICGTPKNEDGKYYCPYCGFESADLEKFAIGMCWDCLLGNEQENIQEEEMGKFAEGQQIVVKETVGKLTVLAGDLLEITTANGEKIITTPGRVRAVRPSWWPVKPGDSVLDDQGNRWNYREIETRPGVKNFKLVKYTGLGYSTRSPARFIEENPKAKLYIREGSHV